MCFLGYENWSFNYAECDSEMNLHASGKPAIMIESQVFHDMRPQKSQREDALCAISIVLGKQSFDDGKAVDVDLIFTCDADETWTVCFDVRGIETNHADGRLRFRRADRDRRRRRSLHPKMGANPA